MLSVPNGFDLNVEAERSGLAEEEGRRSGPAWLRSLLFTSFFEACPAHPRLTTNLFCLDCAGDVAICSSCAAAGHRGHEVVHIRRSSYHSVIRVKELETVIDISLVQTYMINNDKVVFLRERPQAPRHSLKCVGAAGACTECGRALLDDAFRFCSLGCKLDGVASDPNVTFTISPRHSRELTERDGDSSNRTISYRKRPRKGIPVRAPFF